MKRSMMAILLSQMLMGTVWAASAGMNFPPAAGVGAGVGVGESYNDNFLSQEVTRKSSWITSITPSLAWQRNSGSNSYNMSYTLAQQIFHKSNNDSHLDHLLNAHAKLGFSRRINVLGTISYTKASDARGTTFTGRKLTFSTPDKYHQTLIGGTFDYGRNSHIIVTASFRSKRYDNHLTLTKVRDLDQTKMNLTYKTPATQAISAVLEANYMGYKYLTKSALTDLNSSNRELYLGVDWEMTAKTTGKARVGYVQKKLAQSENNRPGFLNWQLTAMWEPKTYSIVNVVAKKHTVESAGTGLYIVDTSTYVSWNHDWSNDLSHKIYMSYEYKAYQRKTNPRLDKKTMLGLSMNYKFGRNLGVQASYDFTNNVSDSVLSSYKSNIWMLNVNMAL